MTVIGFKDVLSSERSDGSQRTGYKMKLVNKPSGVVIRGDVIYIKSAAADIRFTVASSVGDKENYFPTGITFVRQGTCEIGDEQRLGLSNFPQRKTRFERRSLSISARFKRTDNGVLYKFSVIIQRGSDGKIGIIDPGIGHDNSSFH
jgi:hypothetical protein